MLERKAKRHERRCSHASPVWHLGFSLPFLGVICDDLCVTHSEGRYPHTAPSTQAGTPPQSPPLFAMRRPKAVPRKRTHPSEETAETRAPMNR